MANKPKNLDEDYVILAAGIEARGMGCVISRNCSFDAVYRAVKTVRSLTKKTPWWYGDLLNQGFEVIGDKMDQIVAMAEIKLQTLQHYSYMARRFPPAERYEELEFGHHEKVVSFESEERRRLLELAIEKDWSIVEFANYVRGLKQLKPPADPAQPVYDTYVMAKIARPLNSESVDQGLADGVKLKLDDILALGLAPIANEDVLYVIGVQEKAATNIEESGPLCEDDVKVPEPAFDYRKLTPAKLADEVLPFIKETGRCTASIITRKFNVTHTQAVRAIEVLEQQGVVGPADRDGNHEIEGVEKSAPFA